jgi:hypothetical protein
VLGRFLQAIRIILRLQPSLCLLATVLGYGTIARGLNRSREVSSSVVAEFVNSKFFIDSLTIDELQGVKVGRSNPSSMIQVVKTNICFEYSGDAFPGH